MLKKSIRFLLVLTAFALAACQKAPANNPGEMDTTSKEVKQVVYTSFFPIYDLTQSLAGPDFDVRSFMPLEAEAHDWEPSAKDIKELSQADLLVVNGAGMEAWLPKVQEALPDLKVLDLSQGLDLIKASHHHDDADEDHDHDHDDAEEAHDHDEADEDHDHHDEAEEAHDHEEDHEGHHHHHHGPNDPHSFLSLSNAIQYVDKINQALGELNPDKKAAVNDRAQALSKDFKDLLDQYKEVFAQKKNKTFIVPHQAFGYLARDFGLEQYPLQGLTSVSEPDLKTIQEAIATCKTLGIKTVFYEFGGPSKGAEAIAKEAKIEAAPLATMEMKVPGKDGQDLHYKDLMEMNLKNIAESLGQ